MKYAVFVFSAIIFLSGALLFSSARAQTDLISRVSGRILLDVEHNGEAWYVYPPTRSRYYLGRPQDAWNIMRFLGLGISNANLAKIPTDTDTFAGDVTLRQRLSGRILLQVEARGEAWYVFPDNLKRYYLGRPDDAFRIMTQLGLGISTADLIRVPIATDFAAIIPLESNYQSYALTTPQGTFNIQVVSLRKDAYTMITDTGDLTDCKRDCTAKPLAEYVAENSAVIGIHGTYFCPPDYPPCAEKINSFLPPVFNTAADTMINEKALAVHKGPLIAQTTDGVYRYFHRTSQFGNSVSAYESRTGFTLGSALANYPSLVENGLIVVGAEPIEDPQKLKAVRAGIGYNGSHVYLVVARNASVSDLAVIFDTLGADHALNLDGGGSTALYYGGAYRYGPGRLLPNAILFRKNNP
ncbi:MAG: phosphodiester glycosidase family protein [bacterium]|nr:phosphodiester glycosidase family protein [bacterium]